MSFSIEDVLKIMREYDMDLLQLREAIIAYRHIKSIDKKGKEPIPQERIDDLFNFKQIRDLEDPNKKH